MPPLSLLIKPASGDCNMRCRYCFYHSAHTVPGQMQRMTSATLERLTREALAVSPLRAAFAFQGGEPTLAGLDFFREAVALQARYRRPGQQIANALQTNGLLLDDEWCRFLTEHRFLVGLSLDGERALHDAERVDAGGGGTYDRAVRALRLLRQHGVTVNVLCVVTPDVARRGRQVYRALRELGAEYIQFIPCVDSGGGDVNPRLRLAPDDYGRFLRNVYDLWSAEVKAGGRVGVQFFESVAAVAAGQPPITCQTAGTCAGHLVVEYDGSLYPCDFLVRPERRLGNIHSDSLVDVLHGEPLQEFLAWAVRTPQVCQTCEFYAFCRGGCPYQRTVQGGDPSRPDYFCRGYRAFFRYALPELIRMGQNIGHG